MRLSLCFLLFPSLLYGQDPAGDTGAPPVEEERLEVILGIDEIVQLDFAADARIEVGNEAVLNYTFVPSRQQVTLRGITGGTSSMIIRDRAGNIKKRLVVTVTATAKSAIVKKLRAHLSDVEGLEINIIEGDVVVEGLIYVPKDIGKVVAILSGNEYSSVIRLIELAPQTQTLVAQRMQEEVQGAGHKDVTVRVVNGVFVLEGVVDRPGAKADAQARAQLLLPERIESLAQQFQAVQGVPKPVLLNNIVENPPQDPPQPVPKMVKITAQFVEMNKDYNKAFGFSWKPLVSDSDSSITIGEAVDSSGTSTGEGITTNSSGGLSAVISNLFPKLNSGKSAGYVRSIQSGVALTEDKKPVSISKGGTTTIITEGSENPLRTNIQTTFSVNVTPTIMEKENIRLGDLNVDIQRELSSDSGGAKTENNKISTNLIVKSKESAAIGGVVSKTSTTAYDRDSPTGGATIEGGQSLFSFVRGKNYTENKGQFVVFVTPEILENASDGVQDIRRKFRKRGR